MWSLFYFFISCQSGAIYMYTRLWIWTKCFPTYQINDFTITNLLFIIYILSVVVVAFIRMLGSTICSGWNMASWDNRHLVVAWIAWGQLDPWWRHDMVVLRITDPLWREPVDSFIKDNKRKRGNVSCYLCSFPNKLLNRQSIHRWFETPWRSDDATLMPSFVT